MNSKYANRAHGFTVIELMIVLIIVAILVALAYPSYVDYVRKARRGEAQQLLMNWSINQEIWRSNHSTYAPIPKEPPATPPEGLPAPTHDHYDFSLPVAPTAAAYTLQAAAKSGDDQLKDKAKGDCTVLTITSTGAKLPVVCWGGTSS